MLKHLIKLGAIFLMLLLIACSGSNTNDATAPQQPQQPEQVEETAPENVEAAPGDQAPEAEVMSVTAKPQFIEFYADW